MEVQILSVSQLTNAISRVLEKNFGNVSIEGEISNFKAHSSGHKYFTLKDDSAQISCVMWRSRPLNFTPADGMKVIVTGKITIYPPRGNYQIEVSSVKPVGQGDLFLAYEALKEKLETDGYFSYERKKPIKAIPLNIGVSTSPTGAAIKDILSTIERRFPVCTVYFRPTLVQGEGAAEDIVNAINELNELPLDCIIIGRGGGSIEDLWAYNMEITANAIFNSKIPIVSAVGHETDFTIADFVADHRAPTPTGAAEMITPHTLANFVDELSDLSYTLKDSIESIFYDYKQKLLNIAGSYVFRSINDKIKSKVQKLDESEFKISSYLKSKIDSSRQRVISLGNLCSSLYPLGPLDKGFALLESEGRIITKDEKLGNFLCVDVVRSDEIASVTINNIKKKTFLLNTNRVNNG